MTYIIFLLDKAALDQESGNLSCTGWLLVFINKVLLENMPIHLHTVSGCFSAAIAEFSSYNKDQMTHKPKIFIICPLKKFVDSCSRTVIFNLFKT